MNNTATATTTTTPTTNSSNINGCITSDDDVNYEHAFCKQSAIPNKHDKQYHEWQNATQTLYEQ